MTAVLPTSRNNDETSLTINNETSARKQNNNNFLMQKTVASLLSSYVDSIERYHILKEISETEDPSIIILTLSKGLFNVLSLA